MYQNTSNLFAYQIISVHILPRILRFDMNSVNHAIFEVSCFFQYNEVSVSCDSFGKSFDRFRTKKLTWLLNSLVFLVPLFAYRTGDFQFLNDVYFLVSKLII